MLFTPHLILLYSLFCWSSSTLTFQHQVYIPSTDPQVCCGSCKNISCTFTNENGTTELFTVRSSRSTSTYTQSSTLYSSANSYCACRQGVPGWRTAHVMTAWKLQWERWYLPLGWFAHLSMIQNVFRSGLLLILLYLCLTISIPRLHFLFKVLHMISSFTVCLNPAFAFLSYLSRRMVVLFRAMWMAAAGHVSLQIYSGLLVLLWAVN